MILPLLATIENQKSADHLGSTSLTTDVDGNVVYEARYHPFGEERWSSGVGVTDFGFTSQRIDSYMELLEMGARWYDPKIGRWLSPDTIVPDFSNPQSLNRFSYVYNNPVKFSDPSGHCGADVNDDGSINQGLTDKCWAIHNNLQDKYWITITGQWTLREMSLLRNGLQQMVSVIYNAGKDDALASFRQIWQDVELRRVPGIGAGNAGTYGKWKVEFYDITFKEYEKETQSALNRNRLNKLVYQTIAHELAHVWDNREGGTLSEGLMNLVGGSYNGYTGSLFWRKGVDWSYSVQDTSPALSKGIHLKNHYEDWAETFGAFVVDQNVLRTQDEIKVGS